jgi:hypothetical protein
VSGLKILGDCPYIAYLKPVGLIVQVALWIVVFILHMLHNNNQEARAQIFQLLRSLGIDSTESIPCQNQFRRGFDSREIWEVEPENEIDSSFKE